MSWTGATAVPVSRQVLERLDALQAGFRAASPFAHVVIDDFFEHGYARSLLEQFPAFEQGHSLNENGRAGSKSVVERIQALGPAYRELDNVVQSAEFLGLVGSITGIDDLLYDPDYFGGGTHENRNGQSLDAHIDFNYHPGTDWHRRLNLIVYLNPEWDPAWGGCLELHRDPRNPGDDEVVSIAPVFNRCVIFETTEHSWHGFPAIALPAHRQDVSRCSIALYFYTRERQREQTASRHSTVYVDRPLPDRIRAGHTLDDHDVSELMELLARRDNHNRRLYAEISNMQRRLDSSFAGRLFGVIRRAIARRRMRA